MKNDLDNIVQNLGAGTGALFSSAESGTVGHIPENSAGWISWD